MSSAEQALTKGMPGHGVPLLEVGEALQAFFCTLDSGADVAREEQALAMDPPLLIVLGSDETTAAPGSIADRRWPGCR